MRDYRINIKLKSSFITPFQSDTLWGHICWALRYAYNEDALADFLESYSTDEPALVISNAFPKGYLPYPVLPPLAKKEAMELINRFWGPHGLVLGTTILKILSKKDFISRSVFKTLEGQSISNQSILETLLSDPRTCPKIGDYLVQPCPNKYDAQGKITCNFYFPFVKCTETLHERFREATSQKNVVYHSSISRLSGSALEGTLFNTEETFHGSPEFECYCKLGNAFPDAKLKSCLEFISADGYGKKKSTGKGHIQWTLEAGGPDILNPGANAFMTLSSYVPNEGDPTAGYARVLTKYGKLGGHFACSPLLSGENPAPFKYPLIMFKAGSIFLTDKAGQHFGRIVGSIHPVESPKIVQYGIAYPVALKIEDSL